MPHSIANKSNQQNLSMNVNHGSIKLALFPFVASFAIASSATADGQSPTIVFSSESHCVAKQQPQIVKELSSRLKTWAAIQPTESLNVGGKQDESSLRHPIDNGLGKQPMIVSPRFEFDSERVAFLHSLPANVPIHRVCRESYVCPTVSLLESD
ncbi:MAG: hypothetical protein ABJZ55_06845 [Fuerstiella sp.]